MEKVEDRTTKSFQSQEQSFYSDQWAYNERISDIDECLESEGFSPSQKEDLKLERQRLVNEKNNAIDEWKENHGQYDEEMTKWTLREAHDHNEKGDGLGDRQERYDRNRYGQQKEDTFEKSPESHEEEEEFEY